jgi:outer membrane protein insertion porin family/translocation and assembly module TamA
MWRTSAAVLLTLLTVVPAAAQSRRIEVTDLKLQGVNAVSAGELKQAMATSASSWLPWGQKRYFNRAQFEADLKRIQTFYGDRGFPDAKVASFDLKLNETQDEIAITLVIQEGQPVIVDQVRFLGFDALPPRRFNRLKENAPLKAGAPRDRASLQMTRERALDELRDFGYPYASVRTRETQASEPRTIVVTYEATAGERARFGEIEVAGNTSVSDEVVRRHLTFRPGRLFRLGQMQESQRRLYGLELFEFVNVESVEEGRAAEGAETQGGSRAQSRSRWRSPRPQPEATGTSGTAAAGDAAPLAPVPQLGASAADLVPVRVTVTEGKHRRLNLGVGYGSEEKARTEANWRHVNFFGGARTAGVEARWSSLDRGVRLNFQQPYFFSPRVTFNASAEAWYTREPAFTLDTGGARLTLQRRFSGGGPRTARRAVSSLSVGLLLNREDYSIANALLEDLSRRDEIIALKLDPRTGRGRGVLTALTLDYARNTTGNVLDARRGYVANAHYEEAGKFLQGDYDYREITLEGRHYLALFDRFVWANRLKVGSIAGSGELRTLAPFFKRYFLGGSSSVRGWGRFQVSPLSGSGLPLGGHSMLEASSEVRVPVWGNLSVVLFADAGNVWSEPWEIQPGDLRYAVGPGIRYNTPIGPIRFDVGYQLNPIDGLLVEGKPQPRRFRMHFSVGQAF